MQRHDYCPLSVERLESRRLLAGNVNLVTNNAGDLLVTGDGLDNHIRIELAFEAGFIHVTGEAGTTIRLYGNTGFSQVTESFSTLGGFGVARDLRIMMGGGNDIVEVSGGNLNGNELGFSVGRNLTVNLGSGADSFTYLGGPLLDVNFEGLDFGLPNSSVVGGRATFIGGGGASGDLFDIRRLAAEDIHVTTGAAGTGLDLVRLVDVHAGDDITLAGGSGQTELVVQRSASTGRLTMSGSSGADQILVSSSAAVGGLRINSGSSGTDPVGDYIRVGSSRIYDLLDIDGGAGRTTVEFLATELDNYLAVDGRTTINTGSGDDLVRIDNDEASLFLGDFDLIAGSGDDAVQIDGKSLFTDELRILLGAGADTLDFNHVFSEDFFFPPMVQGNGFVRGGGGFDTIYSESLVSWASDPDIATIEEFLA